ncbi:MAG: SoxR reducing system RseC family protein [bacterium]|nr:SoxR reducing system RseC family protein [bacterium]MCX7916717.1 SoxR reducing system RseC family protein [bacterium]MDW8163998.1 SoxR reducing system RseC family protein [Candidatus Omnitrophota bacterium]
MEGIREKGRVIELKEDIAIVQMEESDRCKGCNLCKKIVNRGNQIEAINEIKAKVGELVEVEISEDLILKLSIFIYGYPLLGFILGVVFSYFLKNVFLKIIVFLFFLVFFWITGFRKGKYYGERTKPKIISKI